MTNNRAERRRDEASANRAARRLMRAIARGLAGMRPPENFTVTEWAECKRYLSTEASAEPGLWRTSRTPYLQVIMDAFTDPKVRHIVLAAASQVGKTEVINNMIGYIYRRSLLPQRIHYSILFPACRYPEYEVSPEYSPSV